MGLPTWGPELPFEGAPPYPERMDEPRCKHCGKYRWDHSEVADVLLCDLRYEPEPPRCYGCDEGWPTIPKPRGQPNEGVACSLDREKWHLVPAVDDNTITVGEIDPSVIRWG